MPKKLLVPETLSFQPRPSFPYAPGAMADGVIITAGQVAWNEKAEVVGVGDVAAQTTQTLSNVLSVLRAGGASLEDITTCTVYITDMRFFDKMNAAYLRFFEGVSLPARTTICTPLCDARMLVEIEATARISPPI